MPKYTVRANNGYEDIEADDFEINSIGALVFIRITYDSSLRFKYGVKAYAPGVWSTVQRVEEK